MRVFVSYRRSDSKDIAARIADNLALVPEIDGVFLDVDAIGHGEHFPSKLEAEIARSDVVLVVIGPGWTGARGDGAQPRLFASDDFVRHETETALRRDKRVIPCLVDDATMPSPADLPDDLTPLAERNAIEVRHTSFRVDIDYLTDSITGRSRSRRNSPARVMLGAAWRFASGFVIAAMVAIAIAWSGVQLAGKPLETILGGRIVLAGFLLVLFGAFQWTTARFIRRFV